MSHGRAWRAFAHLVGQWEMRGYGMYACVERASGIAIGMSGIFHPVENEEPEISWSIWLPEFEGKGYAFEAARALFDHFFRDRGFRRLYAYVEDHNTPSWRLCEKLGMRREGVFVEFVSFTRDDAGNPIYENTMQYAILRREWMPDAT